MFCHLSCVHCSGFLIPPVAMVHESMTRHLGRSRKLDMVSQAYVQTLSITFLLGIFQAVDGSMGGRLFPVGMARGLSQPRSQMKEQPVLFAPKHPRLVLKVQHEKDLSRMRGGHNAGNLEKNVGAILQFLHSCLKTVLPPVVACVKAITRFYHALPTDAIAAQVGLVYCFAGGYYPTLFTALQAAQRCGWQVAVRALADLTDEAGKAIEAAALEKPSKKSKHLPSAKEMFAEKTMVVLATVDPMKINEAVGALYTTWMGVSSVLEREFARTITLSMTIAGHIQSVASFVIAPPVYLCVPKDYHQWVPVVIGWGCKAAAMSVAWRIQRVLTAYISAITGGLMCSRAVMRMLSRRGVKLFGVINEEHEKTSSDEVVGFILAGLGLYSQIGSGIDFKVPAVLRLVTWPMDWAERWIQWQITPNLN